jgi:RNA polymerase sigma factor (TIGR02999 family)
MSLGADEAAVTRLIPVVYEELRRIARRQLRTERPGHTLSTTALVHEAYLRIAPQTRAELVDRNHVLAIASQAMRRILIDYARQHHAERRGGKRERVTFDDAIALADQRAEQFLALDEALIRLAALDPRMSRVVECHFFGGMTEEETADVLGVSARTVRRDLVRAKAWLLAQLDETAEA